MNIVVAPKKASNDSTVSDYAHQCIANETGKRPSGVFKAPNGRFYALGYHEGRSVEDGYVYRAMSLDDHTIEDFYSEGLITPVDAIINIMEKT